MVGKNIMVAVTGGIAAFKAAIIVSQLTQKGHNVNVLMTHAATKFITPLTMQALSRHPVAKDVYEESDPKVISHIDLADRADLFVVAPATANIIGRMALGIGDDIISTTLLATKAPIVIAPAMNVNMYAHPAVQKNIQVVRSRGVYVIDPDKGQLACGHIGEGRMAEPERVLDWVDAFFTKSESLQGKRVLVTAGPTVEQLDPVRYLSNYSSGKMGYALALAAAKAGAEVTLISGPVTLLTPEKVKRVNVTSAEEMNRVVMEYLSDADVIIKAAAVADYRPKKVSDQKIKKKSEELTLTFQKTVDIASEIGKKKTSQQFLVGFAAETENVEEHAVSKLRKKKMDLIIANNVSVPGAGFHIDTNIVTVYDHTGQVLSLPEMTKVEIADRIIHLIGERIHGQATHC